jgi:hypothetical protein
MVLVERVPTSTFLGISKYASVCHRRRHHHHRVDAHHRLPTAVVAMTPRGGVLKGALTRIIRVVIDRTHLILITSRDDRGELSEELVVEAANTLLACFSLPSALQRFVREILEESSFSTMRGSRRDHELSLLTRQTWSAFASTNVVNFGRGPNRPYMNIENGNRKE